MNEDYIYVSLDTIKKLSEAGIENGKEIMLYCKILSLVKGKERRCNALNGYFAEILNITPRTVQRYLDDLKAKGLIYTEMNARYGRIIHLGEMPDLSTLF